MMSGNAPSGSEEGRCKKIEKFLKFFGFDPKVPQIAAVKESDVAKKSRRITNFLTFVQDFFEASGPVKTRAARASASDLHVFVRQTLTGRIRYFLTQNTESHLYAYFCCSRRMYLTGNANVFRSEK